VSLPLMCQVLGFTLVVLMMLRCELHCLRAGNEELLCVRIALQLLAALKQLN
jgi:hypothetical protein